MNNKKKEMMIIKYSSSIIVLRSIITFVLLAGTLTEMFYHFSVINLIWFIISSFHAFNEYILFKAKDIISEENYHLYRNMEIQKNEEINKLKDELKKLKKK